MTIGSLVLSGEKDYETIEFLLQKEDDEKVVYYTYDACLCPLTNISNWSEDWRNRALEFLREQLKDETRAVYVDDMEVK